MRPKDFLYTSPALWFAVVTELLEDQRALAVLRYGRDDNGRWYKVDSDAGNTLLCRLAPHYLFHSQQLDVDLHGVPLADIRQVLRPEQALRDMLQSGQGDPVQQAARVVVRLLSEVVPTTQLGVTGSLLLGLQHEDSDVDIVVYGRRSFQQARRHIQSLLASGASAVTPLDDEHWHRSYRRRGCALSFTEYRRHESRKANKLLVAGVKVDVSLVPSAVDVRLENRGPYRKLRFDAVQARVTADHYAFDLPARYAIDHPEIEEIVVFTNTYMGQARVGEQVEARGWVERDGTGAHRLVVGTSREARREYLRVIDGLI